METIITIFTVLSMYMNAAMNVNSKYCYNADMEDGVVKTVYVYNKVENGITPKFVYHFDYDAQGRLTEKEVCRWDSWNNQYQLDYRLELKYNDEGYELSHQEWDKKAQKWEEAQEKVTYHIEKDHLLSVNYLQKNKQGEFKPSDCLTVLNSYENRLLAEASGK